MMKSYSYVTTHRYVNKFFIFYGCNLVTETISILTLQYYGFNSIKWVGYTPCIYSVDVYDHDHDIKTCCSCFNSNLVHSAY